MTRREYLKRKISQLEHNGLSATTQPANLIDGFVATSNATSDGPEKVNDSAWLRIDACLVG
jgi:hypothetical protein